MTEDFAKALGRRITSLRAPRFGQQSLADEIEVSRNAVIAWEKGASLPDTVNLMKLADLFGVSVDELLGRAPIPDAARPPVSPRQFEAVREMTESHDDAFRALLVILEDAPGLGRSAQERIAELRKHLRDA